MTDRPILFVAGLGRCGTTMTMQMLAAAGVPCAGTAPAYEDIPVTRSRVDHDWLAKQGGKAVKWIDPTQTLIRRTDDAAIFLSRDPEQQARSQLKLIGLRSDRNTRRILKRSLESDTRRALAILRRQFGEHFVLHLHYDKVLRAPILAVHQIAILCDQLDLPFGSITDAAAVIQKRSPACAPDLSAEIGMMRGAT